MQVVEKNELQPDVLDSYKENYCSKVYSGIGYPTWGDMYRRSLSSHRDQLAPFDAGFADAKAKTDISAGERIEIAKALIVPAESVNATTLAATGISWDDMTEAMKAQLAEMRKNDQFILAKQTVSIEDKTVVHEDSFKKFDDVVILPMAGNIGAVRRVGDVATEGESNCELKIHPSTDKGSVLLQLVATKDISVEEVLKLDIPRGGSILERNMLLQVLHHSQRPFYFNIFVDKLEERAQPVRHTEL